MNKSSYVLGIDVGSVSISVAAVDRHRNVAQRAYEFHQGRILVCLKNILSNFDFHESSLLVIDKSFSLVNRTMINPLHWD